MKVTLKTIQYLVPGEHFLINGEEKVTKTVTPFLPYETGQYTEHFPNYLKGYESYYKENKRSYRPCYWVLKDEYRENRPTYKLDVTYNIYDITLTHEGRKEAKRRYYLHLRNMEKYRRLMG